MSNHGQEDCWLPWKCVSLVRNNGTTLDITLNGDAETITFIHTFYKLICEPPIGSKFLREFKLKKIKMKLRYEARKSQMTLSHMF